MSWSWLSYVIMCVRFDLSQIFSSTKWRYQQKYWNSYAQNPPFQYHMYFWIWWLGGVWSGLSLWSNGRISMMIEVALEVEFWKLVNCWSPARDWLDTCVDIDYITFISMNKPFMILKALTYTVPTRLSLAPASQQYMCEEKYYFENQNLKKWTHICANASLSRASLS